MAAEKAPFIHVDDLMPKITLPQVAAFYGVELPELKQIGGEIRSRCFLNCGKAFDTSERALAMQADDPTKKWKCFQTGCGKSGNLVSMADLLKPGENAGGKPRAERFKAIAADLLAITQGIVRGVDIAAPATRKESVPEPVVNLPLEKSPNERARALVNLDDKFIIDPAALPPKASFFFRTRSYLTPERCKAFRMGYLPRDGGDDKAGGTMRGRIVYPFHSEMGELLTWFGLDPDFAEKHAEWEKSDKTEKEPTKYHFVKGFHHGIELWGQHLLKDPAHAEKLNAFGLPVVPEPHDVIRLQALGMPSVALTQGTITREQATMIGKLARECAGGKATIWLDNNDAGEMLMKQCLGYLAKECFVRLVWNSKMHKGAYKGRIVSSVREEEWRQLRRELELAEQEGDTVA